MKKIFLETSRVENTLSKLREEYYARYLLDWHEKEEMEEKVASMDKEKKDIIQVIIDENKRQLEHQTSMIDNSRTLEDGVEWEELNKKTINDIKRFEKMMKQKEFFLDLDSFFKVIALEHGVMTEGEKKSIQSKLFKIEELCEDLKTGNGVDKHEI